MLARGTFQSLPAFWQNPKPYWRILLYLLYCNADFLYICEFYESWNMWKVFVLPQPWSYILVLNFVPRILYLKYSLPSPPPLSVSFKLWNYPNFSIWLSFTFLPLLSNFSSFGFLFLSVKVTSIYRYILVSSKLISKFA